MRLNQFLALCGLGSRRSCEALIRDGKISINGNVVTSLSTRVEEGDEVCWRGKPLRVPERVVLAVHKPRGVVTTCKDPQGRPTVLDLVPPELGRLFPVGRLDQDSEGLLLLTNDGVLAQRLAHPSYGVEKEYDVALDRPFDRSLTQKLLSGLVIPGGRAVISRISWKGPWRAQVVLHQGLKRQIRLMFWKLGYEVTRLKRVRVGPVKLRGLAAGLWRQLSAGEIAALEMSVSAGKKNFLRKSTSTVSRRRTTSQPPGRERA